MPKKKSPSKKEIEKAFNAYTELGINVTLKQVEKELKNTVPFTELDDSPEVLDKLYALCKHYKMTTSEVLHMLVENWFREMKKTVDEAVGYFDKIKKCTK